MHGNGNHHDLHHEYWSNRERHPGRPRFTIDSLPKNPSLQPMMLIDAPRNSNISFVAWYFGGSSSRVTGAEGYKSNRELSHEDQFDVFCLDPSSCIGRQWLRAST
jgi:hypothetical protein